MLTFMYITNDTAIAQIAVRAGVNRIFMDMEYIGKDERQQDMDTVKNHHTVDEVARMRRALPDTALLVRINPVHENTQEEIEQVIAAGADIIMLPMWKTAKEVQQFLTYVQGRVKTCLLLETKEAAACLPAVLQLKGIDEVNIGLNDLHISLQQRFLFEPLADGTVEKIAAQLQKAHMPFGFGGFGRLGCGKLQADLIIAEHYRLHSSMAILSRSFCDCAKIENTETISRIFQGEVKKIRDFEMQLAKQTEDYFEKTHRCFCDEVERIAGEREHV